MQRSYSNKVGNIFYQKIAKLFFSIAVADGTVHSKEIESLKRLVRDKWLAHDEILDEYGSDAAFQIEIVFDWLLENEKSSAECYKEFQDFYKEHPKVFSKRIKSLLLSTTNAIASAYAQKNKSELTILGNLHLLFNPGSNS